MIEDYEVGLALLNRLQRCGTVSRKRHLMADRSEQVAQHEAHVFIVVGEKKETHEAITT